MVEVGTGPVEYWHEVVADGVDAFGRQVTKALLVVFYQEVSVRAAILYAFAYRETLHH